VYPAVKAGVRASLPPLDHTYIDYVQWQSTMLASPEGEQHWAYWQQQLAGACPELLLPTDRPRPLVQTYSGTSHTFMLPAPLTRQVKALARAKGVTLHTLLLAAFYVLLHRYTGQDNILVGTFMAGRMRPEFRRIVGYFANPIVLRADLSGNPAFTTLLGQVHQTGLAALQHQDFPFSLLVERLQPARDASRSPLFQVAFVLQQLPRQEELLRCFVPGITGCQIGFGGLVVEPLVVPQQEGQFDLTLEMAEVDDLLCGSFKYNTDLFEATTIARLAGHFQTLLAGIIANPEQPLMILPLLSATEWQQLMAWSRVKATYTAEPCLHELFAAQAERTPNAIAITCDDQHMTYGELNRRANQLAHYLQSLGVGPEVLVGLCVERSLDLVVGILGILKAGGAYVPLDPAYPKERLAFMLEDAQSSVLLTQESLVAALPEHNARLVRLDADQATFAQQPETNPRSGVTASCLAYVIYTSGSTGTPKGAMVSHGNVVRLFTATHAWFQFAAHDVWTLFHSSAFDFSVWELWGALLYGGRLVVVPFWVSRSPAAFYELLCKEHVTVLNQTPSAFRQLLRAEEDLVEHRQDLALRLVIFGGEALDVQSLQPWFTRHGDTHPQLVNMYGITETTVHVTYRPLTMADAQAAQGSPIGIPIPDLELYVLDGYSNPVPMGVPGELHVGGAGVARGYLNRPELTAQRFIPHPFSPDPEARLYKSGDLVRSLPNGTLEYLGRIDHQVKIRGFRIELGEIETVLGQHPMVRETVVLAREDTPGEKHLVAYIVPDRLSTPTHSALRDFLKRKLPDYMIPAAFVILDALPLTTNGKVDRRALPAPARELPTPAEVFVVPRTPLEQTLAEIWAHVLGMPQVGRHDNFFELGGHSLLAVQLLSRVQQTFGPTLPLAALFQAPTVADFALLLADVPHHLAHSVVPLRTTGNQPPLFCMHPAGGQVMVYQALAACLGADQPLYGLQSRALTEGTQEHTTLDEMVADYAAAIRAQQPKGPYYLLGWSMGGLLSLAVAKVLERQGQQVAFNGLLDAYLPAQQDLPWGTDPFLGLLLTFGGTMASALMALAPHALQALRDELRDLSPMERLQCLVAWGQERRLLPSSLPLEHLQQQAALTEAHVTMLGAYRITPVQAPLYVWWARHGLWGTPARPAWSRYALGGIRTEIAAGNHFSMLQPPHVKGLAERLTACLQQARAFIGKGPTPSTITLKSEH
jgi:amino acid adenylation domain-containing protein